MKELGKERVAVSGYSYALLQLASDGYCLTQLPSQTTFLNRLDEYQITDYMRVSRLALINSAGASQEEYHAL